MSDITEEDLIQGLERFRADCELSLAILIIELVKIGYDPRRAADVLDQYVQERIPVRERWNQTMGYIT